MYAINNDRCLSLIFYNNTSCNDIFIRKYSIQQCDLYLRRGILQCDFQSFCLRFFCIDRREPLDSVLALLNVMLLISEIQGTAAIPMGYTNSRYTKISHTGRSIFLRQRIQRIGSLFLCFINIPGKSNIRIIQKIIHTIIRLRTIP